MEQSKYEMVEKTGKKTVVVGAGPVGSLAALYAATRGDEVEVYELRGGMCLTLTLISLSNARVPIYLCVFGCSGCLLLELLLSPEQTVISERKPCSSCLQLDYSKDFRSSSTNRSSRHRHHPSQFHQVHQPRTIRTRHQRPQKLRLRRSH
jgi:hypothetical protein